MLSIIETDYAVGALKKQWPTTTRNYTKKKLNHIRNRTKKTKDTLSKIRVVQSLFMSCCLPKHVFFHSWQAQLHLLESKILPAWQPFFINWHERGRIFIQKHMKLISESKTCEDVRGYPCPKNWQVQCLGRKLQQHSTLRSYGNGPCKMTSVI